MHFHRRLADCENAFEQSSGSSEPASLGNLEGDDALILLTIIPMAIIFAVLLILYACCLHPRCKDVFYANPLVRKTGPQPPVGNRGGFGFIPLVYRMSDDEFEQHTGLDGLVFILFMRMAIKMFAWFGIVGFLLAMVYLSCYYTATDADQESYPAGGLAMISLANVPFDIAADKNSAPWAAVVISLIAEYGLTFWVIYLLRQTWLIVIDRRARALTNSANENSRAVLVHNFALDKPLKREEARSLFDEMFPNEVLGISMIRNTGSLTKLLAKHEMLARRSEHLASKDPDDTAGMCCRKKKVSELRNKTQTELADTDASLLKERKQRLADDSGLNYLVLFRSYRATNTAKQVRMGSKGAMSVFAAPLPDDLNKEVLEPQAAKANEAKKVVGQVLFWLMFLFYLIPVAGLSLLISLDNNDWLADIVKKLPDAVKGLVQGLLPSLALIIFLALLPTICMALAGTQCFTHRSMTVAHAFTLFFRFNLFWNFIGIALGSSAFVIFSVIECVAEDVGGLLTTIGAQLARNAIFFCSYLSVQVLFTLPFGEGTLLVPIIITYVKKKLGMLRKDEAADAPEPYHTVLSKLVYAILIGVAYAVISPVTIIFSIAYCILAYFLYARNLLYFNSIRWPGQGNLWVNCSSQMIIVLYLSHLLVFAIHVVLGSPVTAVLMIPCPIIAASADGYFKREYLPRMGEVSLSSCVAADKHIGPVDQGKQVEEFDANYQQSEFELPEDLVTGEKSASAHTPGGRSMQ